MDGLTDVQGAFQQGAGDVWLPDAPVGDFGTDVSMCT